MKYRESGKMNFLSNPRQVFLNSTSINPTSLEIWVFEVKTKMIWLPQKKQNN